jgi:hypothetical protein
MVPSWGRDGCQVAVGVIGPPGLFRVSLRGTSSEATKSGIMVAGARGRGGAQLRFIYGRLPVGILKPRGRKTFHARLRNQARPYKRPTGSPEPQGSVVNRGMLLQAVNWLVEGVRF